MLNVTRERGIETDVLPASHAGSIWNLSLRTMKGVGIQPLEAMNSRMGNDFDITMYNTSTHILT